MQTKQVTKEDVAQMFYNYHTINAEIEEIEIRIEEAKMQQASENVAQLENALKAKTLLVKRIDNVIRTLTRDEQEFIKLKYFDKRRHKEISIAMEAMTCGESYSNETNIQRKRALILSSCAKFLSKEYS